MFRGPVPPGLSSFAYPLAYVVAEVGAANAPVTRPT